MYLLISRNTALCWLVASLIGAVMFIYATLRFRHQLLAYISILSRFIFSCTLPAVAQSQLVLYYVVMIAFGALMTIAVRMSRCGYFRSVSRSSARSVPPTT